jgi:hypothetical protein
MAPRWTTIVLTGPCHWRAIHSGHDRFSADSHGQWHSGLDLRASLSAQARDPPDLALGAGVAYLGLPALP